jgi:hypothetical protein
MKLVNAYHPPVSRMYCGILLISDEKICCRNSGLTVRVDHWFASRSEIYSSGDRIDEIYFHINGVFQLCKHFLKNYISIHRRYSNKLKPYLRCVDFNFLQLWIDFLPAVMAYRKGN